MVFFICNYCGASLKKNKVEKHYATQCRNVPQVSCMDCHKEFSGNDYVAHTKCITEDEKYSAKGFVPKPSSNKGECKQQEWLDSVRAVQQSQEKLSKNLKNILNAIVNFENIPRKKPKFVNFLKNNNFRFDASELDQLWDLLEKEHKRAKENTESSNTNQASEGQNECSVAQADKDLQGGEKQNEKSSVDVDQDSETTPKIKSKKKKDKGDRKAEVIDTSEEQADNDVKAVEKQNGNPAMEVDQDCEIIPNTKTKKKKDKGDRKSEVMDGSEVQADDDLKAAEKQNENGSMEVSQDSEITPNTKTKKKKDRSAKKTDVVDDAEGQANENIVAAENENDKSFIKIDVESETTPKEKTKKKKDKTEDIDEVTDNSKRKVPEETQLEELPLTKKQKKEQKKRDKYEAELKEIESSQLNYIPLEETQVEQPKKKKSKKDRQVNGVGIHFNNSAEGNVEETSAKGQKKRQLDDDQTVKPLTKKKKGAQDDDQVDQTDLTEQTNGVQKFQWNETIMEVLKSKGGEIPVKRLRKKVVAEYQNCCGDSESEEKLVIKFNKKLLKVPGVTVEKEIAKFAV